MLRVFNIMYEVFFCIAQSEQQINYIYYWLCLYVCRYSKWIKTHKKGVQLAKAYTYI